MIGKVGIERIAAWLFVIGVTIFCFVYFSNFLQPVVLAVMVWFLIYMLKELARRIKIKGKQLPEWLLNLLAFLVIILITYGVVEIVSSNLEKIIESSPIYIEKSRLLLESVQKIEGFENLQDRLVERLREFDFKPLLTGLLNSLSGFAGNFFMIIIYIGFIMAEQKFFRRKLAIMVKGSPQPEDYFTILKQIKEAVTTYALVKTQMSLLTGFLSYVILLMFNVDFPILWAFFIFLLNFIPYIGSLVATLLPSIFAVFQFQSFTMFIWIFVTVQLVQVLVGNVLEPKVMGRTLNLSPLGVLLALTFWGILWGVLGMIISVPITSLLVIIASHIPNLRFLAIWLSETGELNDKLH